MSVYKHLFFRLIITCIILICAYSCLSIKPGSTRSGKKFFETFFAGEQGTQYYIKAVTFKAEQKNETIELDITFRYKDQIKDSAVVNISVLGSEIVKKIDSLTISNTSDIISFQTIKLLFNERINKQFVSRFSTKCSLSEINTLFKKNEWKITTHRNSSQKNYISSKKTDKIISVLNNELFILF